MSFSKKRKLKGWRFQMLYTVA